jgi:chromosome segregation ATPase
MLNFLKKLFAKEEIQEERIELDELNNWLDNKIKPIFENLNNNIMQITSKISDEKGKVNENLKTLENAKLQNPKIPERVKTIMEGNRAAFIKKVSFFFNDIDLKYNDHNELIEKCKNIKNEIDSLGKSTARSYQVLNEFFAREAENIAINIKNVENHTKEIVNLINDTKIMNIDKIKTNVSDIKNKIRLKQQYSAELENNKNDLQNNKNKKTETENKINGIKSNDDYKNYEKLLEEKNDVKAKLNEIENALFHDFSVLEKALKKYAKIAFENEKLILEYLNSPIIALTKDTDFKISNILDSLKNAIVRNEFDLDDKKKEKTLAKIGELDGVYFAKIKDDYNNAKKRLDDLKLEIENNKAKNELNSLNNELNNTNQNIENINNNITNTNSELEKINIEKLKENLQNEVNDVAKAKITLL